jgi:LPS sulfotransferase NodH
MLHLLHQLLHPAHSYALCSVARSGAHFLLSGLRATGMAGRPLQYFHQHLAPKYAARYGFDSTHSFSQYVRGIVAASATRNSVFGVHLEAWDVERFIGQLRESPEFGGPRASEPELLQSALPRLRCIQLTREDKLRQAISKARAIQTDYWVAHAQERPAQEPVFDPDLITLCRLSAERSEETWREFFQRNRIQPLAITYEDLCADYPGTVGRVLDFLRIRPPRGFVLGPPKTVRQADRVTEEWLERYCQLEARNIGIRSGQANQSLSSTFQ